MSQERETIVLVDDTDLERAYLDMHIDGRIIVEVDTQRQIRKLQDIDRYDDRLDMLVCDGGPQLTMAQAIERKFNKIKHTEDGNYRSARNERRLAKKRQKKLAKLC